MKDIVDIFDSILKWLLYRAPLFGKFLSSIFGALEFPFLEFIRRIDTKLQINFTNYVNQHLLEGKWGGRIVPLNRNIEVGTKFAPIQELTEIISRSNVTKVSYCYCRTIQRAKEKPNCDHPLFTCIHLGSGKYLNEVPFKEKKFKHVSKEEVLNLLNECDERGLIHQLIYFPNPDFYYVICNCCPCCCVVLKRFLDEGAPQIVESDFVANIQKDICKHCGTCVKWCNFNALSFTDETLHFEQNKCFGCGICVSKCPNDAISLQLKTQFEK
jgi:ferredoxin